MIRQTKYDVICEGGVPKSPDAAELGGVEVRRTERRWAVIVHGGGKH